MDRYGLTVVLRMFERVLIVSGGILSIVLGYRLFTLGIDTLQGRASGFGVELRNFGPGLFFAALGAVILVAGMRAAVRTNPAGKETDRRKRPAAAADSSTAQFFGIEDPARQASKWSAASFFLDSRTLLRKLDAGESPELLRELRGSLQTKLDSITMTPDEYERFQALSSKVPLTAEEQRELLVLEPKLFP